MKFAYYFRDRVHVLTVAPDGSVPWVGVAPFRSDVADANRRIRAFNRTAETPGGVVRD